MNIEHEAQLFLARFRSAWNAGDARAFAALFTEDATCVIFLGEALIGRAEIESNHVDVFAKWQKGTQMRVKRLAVRPLGHEVCSVLTVGGIGREEPVAFDKLQTFTLVREGEDSRGPSRRSAPAEKYRPPGISRSEPESISQRIAIQRPSHQRQRTSQRGRGRDPRAAWREP